MVAAELVFQFGVAPIGKVAMVSFAEIANFA